MNVSRSFQLIVLTLGLAAAVSACRTRNIELPARYGSANSERLQARAVLAPKSDSKVTGEVDLSQLVTALTKQQDALPTVLAYVRVDGLDAAGAYTLRIHDAANCEAPAQRGDTGPNARTLTPRASGEATLEAALARVTLEDGDARNLIGKSIVVHQGAGDEGAPLACGVIEKVAAPEEAGNVEAAHAEGGAAPSEAH